MISRILKSSSLNLKDISNRVISSTISCSSFFLEFWLLRIMRILKGKNYKFTNSRDFGKISIILPTYNRSSILFSRAIPSVMKQTYTNWELLVVSHGCTDTTNENVLELSRQDERVKLVIINRKRLGYPPSAENHWLVGPVKPINAGLKRVSGLWIARIDDDDEWSPLHLESLLLLLVNSKKEFISSAYAEVSTKGVNTISPKGNPPIGGVQTWIYRSYLVFFRSHLNSWRKKLNRTNDYDVQARMVRAGVRTVYSNDITVKIQPRPGEELIGSKAYLENVEKFEDFYRINPC